MSDDKLEPPGPQKPPRQPGRPRVAPISRVTSSTFSRLKSANCFQEIDRRIRLGWSSFDLANAIHEEFKELTETSVRYLKKLLDRYRESLPVAEMHLISPSSLIGRNLTSKLSKGLDELAEVERLYAMQMKRIEIDIKNEEKITKLLPTTGNEIFVAMKLLKQSSDLKMDLGLVKRQLGSMEVSGQLAAEATERYGRDSVGKVLTDPESRRKVLAMAERFLMLGAKAGIDAVQMVSDAQPAGLKAIDVASTEQSPEALQSVEAKAKVAKAAADRPEILDIDTYMDNESEEDENAVKEEDDEAE